MRLYGYFDIEKGTRPKDQVPYLLPLFRERQGQHEHRTNKIDGGGFVWPPIGGPEGDRTLDLTDANRTLSQTELRAQINSSENGTAEKAI